ncbi:GNAT family N-acetyltransferase [Candidatus Pacearchaeota archaeon]|nr:GNAT family N-acetyltransferase [Candidatus Pacearchaeota archaeon]
MAVKIRNYRLEDYNQLKASLVAGGLYYDDMDSQGLLERMIVKDPESIIIAQDGDKVVGGAYFADMGFAVTLWRLNVIPEYRKRGIGKLLIDEVNRRAKKRGFTQTHFMVHEEQDKLIGGYQKMGAWKGSLFRWMGFDI